MSQIVADVKRAIVKTCMANGMTDMVDILTVSAQAINGIGPMTIPAYKAWMTMEKQSAIKNRKRLNRNRIR